MLHSKEMHGATCEGKHCCHGGVGHVVVKVVVGLMIAACILAIGTAAGFRVAMRRAVGGVGSTRLGQSFGMMFSGGQRYVDVGGYQRGVGMMGRGYASADGNEWAKTATTTQYFGSINRIEGSKITIVDNGAAERVVLSQSTTLIGSATGVMGLSELKPGQKIDAVGTIDANNQLLAQTIRVY